jgi:2-methylisocitrate lyase-like PEP mutase family enzyme
MTRQQDAARAFRAMHATGFILPNAWDAGSAKILAAEGFQAIGTTSAGIAFSLGKQDYQVSDARLAVSRDEMFTRMAEIVAAVAVPVSGDLEAGFGDAPDAVAGTVRQAIEIGLAGGNIEDQNPATGVLYDEALAVERIAAARAAGGSRFVLNARTDVLFGSAPDALATTIRRANRYLAAGADCVFTPGARDLATIATLAREIAGPVNIVIGLVGPIGDARAVIAAGARRVSVGGTIARSVMAFVRQCARELHAHGTIGFSAGQIAQDDLNRLFAATPPGQSDRPATSPPSHAARG